VRAQAARVINWLLLSRATSDDDEPVVRPFFDEMTRTRLGGRKEHFLRPEFGQGARGNK